MRRSLLRLIGVGEFSAGAEWTDPCSSYMLLQVSCTTCGLLKDVDLCRDAVVSDKKRYVIRIWRVLRLCLILNFMHELVLQVSSLLTYEQKDASLMFSKVD